MRLILLLVTSAALAACITDPTPGRSSYCFYPGDTIGFAPLIQKADSVIVACIYPTEVVRHCFDTPVKRISRATTPCVEGTKWKG